MKASLLVGILAGTLVLSTFSLSPLLAPANPSQGLAHRKPLGAAGFPSFSVQKILLPPPDQDLRIAEIDSELEAHRWLERANHDELGTTERLQLAAKLTERNCLFSQKVDAFLAHHLLVPNLKGN